MAIRIRDPKTGAIGMAEPDALGPAVQAGAEVLDPVDIFDPETKAIGKAEPSALAAAFAAGAVPVGSRAHQVASTGMLESGARGLAQGATLGFFDELQAGLRAPFSDSTYEQLRDEYRAGDKLAEEANPTTFKVGEVGGGIGTAFIPGLGMAKAAKTATTAMKVGQEAALGAKLGAASSVGYSEKEGVPALAEEALKGAATGGVLGGALNVAGKVATPVASAVGTSIKQSFDPTVQRMLALGAKSRDLTGMRGTRVESSIQAANKLGLFTAEEGALPPNLSELIVRMEKMRSNAAEGMSEIFTKTKGHTIGVDEAIDSALTAELDKILVNAPPDERLKLASTISSVMDDILHTQGDLGKLWQVKKNTGRWVGPDWEKAMNRLPSESEAYQAINRALGTKLEQATEQIAQTSNNQTLRQLNEQYGAMATLQDMARKQEAAGLWQANLGGMRVRDWVLGLGAGSVGGPVVGAAAAVAGKAYGSAPVRLMRAKIGEALHIGEQQQATMAGAIPRTTDGIKQFVNQYGDMIDQMAPGLRQQVTQILAMPQSRAEIELRALMPMVQQFMAPSPYQSELNGKVSSPQDKAAITGQLQQMKLKPSELAIRMSMLNKDGTIPPEVYTPGEEYGDELQDFANNLLRMGY